MSRHQVTLTENGEQRQAKVEARTRLVHLLREDLGVTGVHVGSDTTQCGACTVHLDGRAVKSCTVLAVQADGATVDTLQSLSKAGAVEHPLLAAFGEHHALQRGFCTPGMIMSSLEVLQREPQPTRRHVPGGRPRAPAGQRPAAKPRRHPHPAILSDAEKNRRRT